MDNSNPDSLYSPAPVAESPVTKKAHGNLTGNVRKVRDCAADLYNLIQTWNESYIKGATIIKNIIAQTTDSKRTENQKLSQYEDLQKLCDELEDIIGKMKDIVDNFETIYNHLHGITKLESRGQNIQPLFLTWKASKFEETAEKVYSNYKEELNLKTYILQNIAHVNAMTEKYVLLYLWIHQPYIDEKTDFELQAMLKETGHR